MVIFGRHDLVQDAPISQLDLLVCRNALMYFNAEVQARILARFHFALRDGGVIFLGKAEMMRNHASLLAPAHLKARIFTRPPRADAREQALLLGRGRGTGVPETRLRDAAFGAEPAARLVVDRNGALAMANDAARALFDIAASDVGKPLHSLRVSYSPMELRPRLEEVAAGQRALCVAGVPHTAEDGRKRFYDVQLLPLHDGDLYLGVSVGFTDVTPLHHLQAQLQDARQELEKTYEELRSTTEELQRTVDELETTGEELHTTNEELETMNGELQSTNEELQGTNAELATINDELRQSTHDLGEVNAYMTSILTSLRAGVVVLDRQLRVRVWNHRAEELWGVRAGEVEGRPLLDEEIGLAVAKLKAPVRACLEGAEDVQELVLEARNRRGRNIRCRVTCSPLLSRDRDVRGVVLVMEEWAALPTELPRLA
jgi:two-component system CheB/CheR fusion protein